MTDIEMKAPVWCQRCNREVFFLGRRWLCKGCLIGELTGTEKRVFMVIRELNGATDSMIAERVQMSVGSVELILGDLETDRLIHRTEILWKERR